jgi:hypothetical protein|uniref:Uncharacterized protein n=1 Tax=Myoviridae sp. ctNQV2 TaxID=2827683 RepID=A0A8S5RZ64_9CAUD|nr:MAG TPA: hypothetical protein [Myoviridae sp. ctNQV2]
MLYKGLNIVNCDCIRYFQLMKDNQYLAIIDQEGIIKASFIKMNGKIYEYFDIFTIKCLDDYKEFAYPLSFLFRNEPNAKTYIYHICDEYEWNEILKANNLKWAREKLKDNNSNAKLIYEEILKDGGKFVSFGSLPNDVGLLVCAVSSDEDYYWVYIETNLKVHLSSCVGGYEIIEGNEVEFNILKHLIENDPESLYLRILENFKGTSDAIFTPIVISETFKKE